MLLPILLAVSLTVFFLLSITRGDPAAMAAGEGASAEVIELKRQELHLDEPFLIRYLLWLKDLIFHFDLGNSYANGLPVTVQLVTSIGLTLKLAAISIVIAMLIGIPMGIVAAVRQYSIFDNVVMFLGMIGMSMPIFWLGLMLVNLFSVQLGWLPALGMGSMSKGIGDVISHMVLPCFCLATIPTATFARITRSSMLEVIHSDSIKALRARGIKESSIIWKHALKNALPPIVTVLGLQLASAFTGAILTESIFSWPGMGTMIVSAIDNRDYMLIQGTVLFIAVVFVVVNLLVDVVYMIINPRVSYDSKGGN